MWPRRCRCCRPQSGQQQQQQASSLVTTLPRFQRGDEKDDDENPPGLLSHRAGDDDGEDVTEYALLLPRREVGGSSRASRLVPTLPGFQRGDDEDDDENPPGLLSHRVGDDDGEDVTEYGNVLMDKHGRRKVSAKRHDEGAAESDADSKFEAGSARVEARTGRQQNNGSTKVKEEDVVSVAALAAKRPPFYAALGKVIASAKGYDQ